MLWELETIYWLNIMPISWMESITYTTIVAKNLTLDRPWHMVKDIILLKDKYNIITPNNITGIPTYHCYTQPTSEN